VVEMFTDSFLILGIAFFTAFLSEGKILLQWWRNVDIMGDFSCRHFIYSGVQNRRLQETESYRRETEQKV